MRSRGALAVRLSLAILACGWLGSCQITTRSYHALSLLAPHKDSVVVRVVLDEAAEAAEYRNIAERELAALLVSRGARNAVPLYEVRFDFHTRGSMAERCAVVLVRFEEGREAPDWSTFLY